MTDKELYDLAYKEDLTVMQILRKIYDKGYSKAENDYHKQTEKDRESSYQLGYSKAIDDILHKLNDTGVEITFDLPVEEILGEDVDLDDFSTLLQDAIKSYRKMVISIIEQSRNKDFSEVKNGKTNKNNRRSNRLFKKE